MHILQPYYCHNL